MSDSKRTPADVLRDYSGPLADMRRKASAGICPFCDKEVKMDEFTDALSRKEFRISGLCQKCQDEVFAEPEE